MTAKKETKTNKSAADVADLEKQIAEKDARITELDERLLDADTCIKSRDATIMQLQEHNAELTESLKEAVAANERLSEELALVEDINDSRATTGGVDILKDCDVVTVKLLPHHPTGTYLRCGIEFTLGVTAIACDDLTDKQLQVLINDPWLDVAFDVTEDS